MYFYIGVTMDQQTAMLSVAGISAFSTIVGVIVANFFNMRLANKRLDFENIENDKKRKSELRKEIYLSLAEDYHFVEKYIFESITNRDVRNDQSAWGKFNSNFSKLMLIANNSIIKEMEVINGLYNKVMLDLQVGLKEIRKLEVSNDVLNKHIEKKQAEFDALIDFCNKLKINLEELENVDLKILFENIKNLESKISIFQDEVIENYKELSRLNVSLFEEVLEQLKPLQLHKLNLMNLMRLDFGIEDSYEFDLEGLNSQFEVSKGYTLGVINKVRV